MRFSNSLKGEKMYDRSITIFIRKFFQERERKRWKKGGYLWIVTIFFKISPKTFFLSKGKEKEQLSNNDILRRGTINSRSSDSLDTEARDFRIRKNFLLPQKRRDNRAKNFKNQVKVFRNRFLPSAIIVFTLHFERFEA